jgi:hypothetical protein
MGTAPGWRGPAALTQIAGTSGKESDMKNLALATIGLLGLIAGCCHQKEDHWAGVCDCDPRTYSCRTGPGGADAMIQTNGIVKEAAAAEPLKVMPAPMP